MEKEKFTFGNNEISYFHSDVNKGKQILLMHGYNFNTQIWIDVGLVEKLNGIGYDVFSLDVPGFPKSENHFELSRDDMEKMLEVFIKDKMHSKAIILGASASGRIALEFAENHSDLLSKLILVDPVYKSVEFGKLKGIDVLGIWGSNDPISKPFSSVAGNIKLAILKGAGHACYLDKPKEFNSAIANFLEGNIR